MVLLLQLNGELPDFAGHERRLYVLSCRRKTCRQKDGSVRALRGVRISEGASKSKSAAEVKPQEETPLAKANFRIGEDLFGVKPSNLFSSARSSSAAHVSNPFATSQQIASNPIAKPLQQASQVQIDPTISPSRPSDLPQSFASALSLNGPAPKFGPPPPPELWPQESDLPPAYPLYYLDPDYEELDKVEAFSTPAQTMDIDEGGGSGSQKEDKDAYEDTIDKTFQRFADRLAQNPEQVIRYEFKGQPLLYSKTDSVGRALSGSGNMKVTTSSGSRMPRCVNCGSARVFEVQLTPHSIIELEKKEEGFDGMEWGTIIVGVCEKDCQQKGVYKGVGYIEEWAGVQWEESGSKR